MPPRLIPPASPGLPPAGVSSPSAARDKLRNKYPAKQGRMSNAAKDKLAKTTLEVLTANPDMPAADLVPLIAKEVPQDTAMIKTLIKKARNTLNSRAEAYVDIHLAAAQVAAAGGDAKPAQWALEHIQEGEQRIVEREKAGPGQPAIQIGIAVGGLPQPRGSLPELPIRSSELPAIEANLVDQP